MQEGRIDFGVVTSPVTGHEEVSVFPVRPIRDTFVAGYKFWEYKNRIIPLKELAEALDSGLAIGDITYIRGTAYRAKDDGRVYEEKIMTPSFEEVKKDKRKYAEAFRMQYLEQD